MHRIKKEERRDSTSPMLNKWFHCVGNSISVCIVRFSCFTLKPNIKIYSFTTLILRFILYNLNNNNKFIITLDLIKYTFPLVFHLYPHAAPTHYTNNKGRWFYLLIFRSRGFLYWCILQKSGLKITLLYYSDQPCRDWWKARCEFPRVIC